MRSKNFKRILRLAGQKMRLVPFFYKIVAEIVYGFALSGQSYICDRKTNNGSDGEPGNGNGDEKKSRRA